MGFKKYFSFLIIVLLMFVVAACGSETKEDGTTSGQKVDGNNSSGSTEDANLEGSVVIDGSGTVYPLMAAIAESYMTNEQEQVSVEVSRSGTSAGFGKFLMENGTDFNDASRTIKDEEKATAEELGLEIAEFKVALDGLTFVVHPDNDWAVDLTADEIISIFYSDGGVTKWSDIRPEFPDEKINTMGPNENHGTYEFFYENILDKADLVDDVNLQQEYSTLVNLVSEDINGIAFFGFGYYVNNQDKLKAVHIDFGNGPVEPSLDSIAEDGDYADFTRPVYTYLNVGMAKEKPQVLDFALYLINNVNNFAGETGFAPLQENEIWPYIEALENLK